MSGIEAINDPNTEEEQGRTVTRLYVYTCREMPIEMWQCRPATNEEYAAVCVIWREAWPYLTLESRKSPPTGWQYCVYHNVLQKHMGYHRDNFFRTDLKELAYESGSLGAEGKWCGVENSQVRGSCVIIYSMGNCPMNMILKVLSTRGGAYQEKRDYVVAPTFTIPFEKGHICVWDGLDDLLMLHGLEFDGIRLVDNKNELVRIALVIRHLKTIREFYTDTSTIRLTGESLKFAGRASGCEKSLVYRGVNS